MFTPHPACTYPLYLYALQVLLDCHNVYPTPHYLKTVQILLDCQPPDWTGPRSEESEEDCGCWSHIDRDWEEF